MTKPNRSLRRREARVDSTTRPFDIHDSWRPFGIHEHLKRLSSIGGGCTSRIAQRRSQAGRSSVVRDAGFSRSASKATRLSSPAAGLLPFDWRLIGGKFLRTACRRACDRSESRIASKDGFASYAELREPRYDVGTQTRLHDLIDLLGALRHQVVDESRLRAVRCHRFSRVIRASPPSDVPSSG